MGKSNGQDVEISNLTEMLVSKGKYRKIVQAAISNWVKRFQDGEIQVDTIEDLRTLIQIDMELQRNIANDQYRVDRLGSRSKNPGGG